MFVDGGSHFNHSCFGKSMSGFLFYDFSTSNSSVWLIKVNILYLISYIICDCVFLFLKNILLIMIAVNNT